MLDEDVTSALIREGIHTCEQACDELIAASENCADACLTLTGDGDITACFLADLDCSEIGLVTIKVLSWTTSSNRTAAIAILDACVEACTASAIACERVAHLYGAWDTCTGACHRLSNACTELQAVLAAR